MFMETSYADLVAITKCLAPLGPYAAMLGQDVMDTIHLYVNGFLSKEQFTVLWAAGNYPSVDIGLCIRSIPFKGA